MSHPSSRRYSTSLLRFTPRKGSWWREASFLRATGSWSSRLFSTAAPCVALTTSTVHPTAVSMAMQSLASRKTQALTERRAAVRRRWSFWISPSCQQPSTRWRDWSSVSSGISKCWTSRQPERIRTSTENWRVLWKKSRSKWIRILKTYKGIRFQGQELPLRFLPAEACKLIEYEIIKY